MIGQSSREHEENVAKVESLRDFPSLSESACTRQNGETSEYLSYIVYFPNTE